VVGYHGDQYTREEHRVAEPQQLRCQPTRRQVLWAAGSAALAFLIIIICGYLFGWKWTGVPNSTLWDWLDLLIVPAVLVIGGYLLTERQRTVDQKIAGDQAQTDRHLADQRRQDDALQAYLDQMSQLILQRNLLGPKRAIQCIYWHRRVP
jgi:hypothetical protein